MDELKKPSVTKEDLLETIETYAKTSITNVHTSQSTLRTEDILELFDMQNHMNSILTKILQNRDIKIDSNICTLPKYMN